MVNSGAAALQSPLALLELIGRLDGIRQTDRMRAALTYNGLIGAWNVTPSIGFRHDVNGNKTMAMSFYPNEGEPLWSKYSTHSIIHDTVRAH